MHDASRLPGRNSSPRTNRVAVDRNRQDEDAERVRPLRLQRVRLWQRQDEIRRRQLPALGPRCGGCGADRAASPSGARRPPSVAAARSLHRQRMLADERAVGGSAFHGGMNAMAVTVAICAACRFASA